MIKKLLCTFAAIMFLPSLFQAASAFDPVRVVYEDLVYMEYEDHVELIGVAAQRDGCIVPYIYVDIPVKVNGKYVTEIGENAFSTIADIYGITIPVGVKKISEKALLDCNSLKSIKVSFDNENYESLDGVLFSKGMERLVKYPCKRDGKYYAVPVGVREIAANAFFNCTLETIELSETVETIETSELRPFPGCGYLKKFIVSEDNPCLKAIDGVLFENDKLLKYPVGLKLREYNVPDGTTVIGGGAFYGADLLRVSIPDSVVTIEKNAFRNCDNLLEIADLPQSLTYIGEGVFYGCTHLRKAEFPEGITGICDNMFNGCTALKDVAIPKSAVSIGERSFANCKAIESIELPESLADIGNYAFYSCSAISELYIPEGTVNIGEQAFAGCSRIVRAELPKSLKTIGKYAFGYCPVTDVYYGGSEAERDDISGILQNSVLQNAVWHYNIKMPKSKITVTVNGNEIDFDQAPIIENGCVLVPMRELFAALGGRVSWSYKDERATAAKLFVTLSVEPNSGVMTVNGKEVPLGSTARVVNGKMFIPVRNAAEAFGYSVSWNNEELEVMIETK